MNWWTRTASLATPTQVQSESWSYTPPHAAPQTFELKVRTGKPLDVMGLKQTTLDELRDYAAFLAQTAQQLYAQDVAKKEVKQCPCCHTPTTTSAEVLRIFDVAYVRCSACGHVFIGAQPDSQQVTDLFEASADHSQIYIDPETLEVRLTQVVAPKVNWVLETYQQVIGESPTTCIDVGAGGGHFVAGMHRQGIKARGFELSHASRAFAKQAFDLELVSEDFLATDNNSVDIVTMWGLLEYTPEPRQFLEKARKLLQPKHGLLVVEVPRFDALGTIAQAENPKNIARHMDPTSHLNCFSDSSLATALVETGFRPVAVWYFGMDAYELLVQLAIRLNNPEILEDCGDMIPALQASCDAGRQCDDLIMAAIPEA
ncbi:MAG: class I SAM-dependent methyltransferase [Leptolyngbyaceae cyanobacterium]